MSETEVRAGLAAPRPWGDRGPGPSFFSAACGGPTLALAPGAAPAAALAQGRGWFYLLPHFSPSNFLSAQQGSLWGQGTGGAGGARSRVSGCGRAEARAVPSWAA